MQVQCWLADGGTLLHRWAQEGERAWFGSPDLKLVLLPTDPNSLALEQIEALESPRTLDCQESKGKLDKDSPRSNSVVSADGTPAPPTLSSPLFHTVARCASRLLKGLLHSACLCGLFAECNTRHCPVAGLLTTSPASCRAIQPQWHNRWHLAAVYLLVWGGCFFGSYLGGNYLAESYTFFTSAGISPYPNTLYWKVGLEL